MPPRTAERRACDGCPTYSCPITTGGDRPYPGRNLTYLGFAAIVVVYLLLLQAGGLLIGNAAGEDSMDTTRGVVFTTLIPIGLALVFTYGVIARLGWTRSVLVDDKPVNRWVWAVPVILGIAILLGIDYGALADKGLVFTLVLLIATQFVGWGEEGMFRGIGVTGLRRHGLTEGRVALWSSLIFGVVHLSNIVGLAGYFFYLTRRVSGSNAVNSVLHGLFDFALISGSLASTAYVGTFAPILAYPVLAVLLLMRRNAIETSR
ncbi:CPBP family intramembrane glutamic endopeptidase [Gordonia malaquae]|uniref:CPBP family intramembrane glutamic endopeptidase n=1 Tax=Gordonia malaquae TaxID=410332 RepID=UPI0030FE95BA